jgi:hypothetical protein
MRQGLILFADAVPSGSAAAQALKTTVDAALAGALAVPFIAYAEQTPTQALRELVGGPPPRFFPQAARNKLGERFAQALAFLFIQDYDRVVLLSPGYPALSEAQLAPLFATLDEQPLWVDEQAGAYGVAVRRADFPLVAVVFDDVRWEKPGAREAAARLLAAAGGDA